MAVRGNIVGIDSPEALERALRSAYYLADEGLATAAYLALALGKPLLLEGSPGVGKTEAAKAIAAVLARRLIRLQCYEGIDASAALYEWNYPRQMLAIRQAGEQTIDIYGEPFLIERPMLAALRSPDSTVLLIDEIDRSDQEFEAFLLEFLSDFQISIPERGTVRAAERPVVVLTSNRTRDLHEALRRRCVYHWINYPTEEREARIVMLRASSVAEATARAVVAAVGKLRREPLSKAPGIAEAVDWAEAATLLHKGGARWPEAFRRSIGVALKDEEDLHFIAPRLDALIAEAAAWTRNLSCRMRRASSSLSWRCCAPTASRSHRSRPRPFWQRSNCLVRAASSTSARPASQRSLRRRSGARPTTGCSISTSAAARRSSGPRVKTRMSSASRRKAAVETSRHCPTKPMNPVSPRREPRPSSSAALPTASAMTRCVVSPAKRRRGYPDAVAIAACAPDAVPSPICGARCATASAMMARFCGSDD